MKKYLLLASTAFFLSGCSLLGGQKATIKSTDSSSKMVAEMSKISAAIERGESIKCVITDNNSEKSMTYYMKGQKMKMMGIVNDADGTQTTNMINDGQYLYSWDDSKKEGFKFAMPEETPEEAMEEKTEDNSQMELPDFSKEETQKQYQDQGYKIECEVMNVADSEFVPPTDVVFTDLAAMMEKMMEVKY